MEIDKASEKDVHEAGSESSSERNNGENQDEYSVPKVKNDTPKPFNQN